MIERSRVKVCVQLVENRKLCIFKMLGKCPIDAGGRTATRVHRSGRLRLDASVHKFGTRQRRVAVMPEDLILFSDRERARSRDRQDRTRLERERKESGRRGGTRWGESDS